MGGALNLAACICGGDSQAHTAHDNDVGEIVAGVGSLFLRDAALREDFLEDRNFLDVALIDVGHLDLAGTFGCSRRLSSADDAGGDAVPGEPLQGDTVLR